MSELPAPNPRLQRLVWTVMILLVAGLMAVYVRQTLQGAKNRTDRTLAVYHQVPPFQFTERSGKTITNDDLKGKVWVASFIFTRCPGICKTLTQRLRELQDTVKRASQVQLVSFTVDPDYDTPEILQKYGEKFEASPDRWWFLTGERQKIHELSRKSFLLAVEKNAPELVAQEGEYLHSSKLILVDPQGVIRGYYEGLIPENMPQLVNDIGVLLREAGK